MVDRGKHCLLYSRTSYHVNLILYCQHGNYSIPVSEKKLKTEGITDLTLFTEKIDFDAEEPNLIVEDDSTVLEDTSPAVNYKEIMLDI